MPPYPVAVDKTGERTMKVETLDEFIDHAEKTIAEAEAVLNTQAKKKR
jgi:hypothetical protein